MAKESLESLKSYNHWTHSECLKAGKIFRKHGIKCRTYKTKEMSMQGGASYLLVYVDRLKEIVNLGDLNGPYSYHWELDPELSEAFKKAKNECKEKDIDYTYKTKPLKK